jgi:hypothetical protein
MLLPLLWRLGRALSHDVATKDDTSSNQAMVSGGVEVVISVKLYDKICGCDAYGCAYPAGKFPCPDIFRPRQKVALCTANRIIRFPLPAFPNRFRGNELHFRLSPPTFLSLKLFYALQTYAVPNSEFRIAFFLRPCVQPTKSAAIFFFFR